MKVLVTGSNGQLGYDVCRQLEKQKKHSYVGIDIDDVDITDEEKVKSYIVSCHPDVVVHCAAWTQVDKAEQMEEKVYATNSLATKYIAEACQAIHAKMVYISTDYVFDGNGSQYYEIDDETKGLSVYGKTKLAGEIFVKNSLKQYWIIRISWVFGINGNNFVKTMLKLAQTKKEINVVCDQIGSPTYTYDLSKLICDMIETNQFGIYHATNEGVCSWYDFAKYIFEVAGITTIKVNPVTTTEYQKMVPSQAKRPFNSRLSKESLIRAGFKKLPTWEDATKRYILNELKIKN